MGKLPYSHFKWIPEYHLQNFKVTKIDSDILEVDLIFSEELHGQ
jgi:hypothetical protein